MNPFPNKVFGPSILLPIFLIVAVAAHAVGDNWTSTSSGAWGTASNWSAGVPTGSSVATFNSATGLKTAIALSASSTADSLVFSATGGANAYTFDTAGTVNTDTLTLTSGITNSAAATQTFYNTFTLAGNQAWNAGSGALVFNGNVNLGSGASSYSLTVNGSNAVTLAGIIANGGTPAGSLTYSGSGTLTLKGANTYTGATSINSGTVNLQSAGALGTSANTSATTVASGATLQLQNNITTTNLGTLVLNGTGVSGSGALQNVSGNNRWNSDVTLASNSTIFSSTAGNTLYIGNASYGTSLFRMGANTVTVDGPGDVWFDSNVGVSGDTGGFIKNGTGKVTFYGSNTYYTGATMVNAGSLDLIVGPFSAGQYGIMGSLTIGNGSGAAGAAVVNIASNSYANQISPTSAVTINSDGVLNVGAATSLGSLALNGGQAVLSSGITLTPTGAITSNTNSALQTAQISGGQVTLGASTSFTVGRDTSLTSDLTVSSVLAGTSGLTKQGAGILTLSGPTANTYTGTTSIKDGTLQLNKTSGTNAIAGGPVTIGDGVGAANSASITLLASNQIADTAAITINSDGQLNLNNQSEQINTLAGTGMVATGTTGYLGIGASSGSSTFSGTLTGTGVIEKLGTGTLTFNASFNFSGELRITSGTVVLAGITATVGTLHITGNTVLDFGNSSASTLNATTLIIDSGVTLTITNWVNTTDYFYAQNFNGAAVDTHGTTPETQIVFTGFPANNTGWQGYDHQVTPAPEPATYGAIFVALCLGAVGLRRRLKIS